MLAAAGRVLRRRRPGSTPFQQLHPRFLHDTTKSRSSSEGSFQEVSLFKKYQPLQIVDLDCTTILLKLKLTYQESAYLNRGERRHSSDVPSVIFYPRALIYCANFID